MIQKTAHSVSEATLHSLQSKVVLDTSDRLFDVIAPATHPILRESVQRTKETRVTQAYVSGGYGARQRCYFSNCNTIFGPF
jgi:hypothetical protein